MNHAIKLVTASDECGRVLPDRTGVRRFHTKAGLTLGGEEWEQTLVLCIPNDAAVLPWSTDHQRYESGKVWATVRCKTKSSGRYIVTEECLVVLGSGTQSQKLTLLSESGD